MDEMRPQLDALRDEDFSSRVGEVFCMRLNADESLDLTLIEVHAHKYAPPNQKRRGFSVLFRSDLPKAAPQAIYSVTHDALGSMDLFLVPVGPKDGGMCYEAVFN
jgi:hypothetical protein